MNHAAGFDLVVLGAGIVGLAHALAGARRGLRVAVVERDTHCVGASIRNFGFVAVTGQSAAPQPALGTPTVANASTGNDTTTPSQHRPHTGPSTWQRARRSRDIWAEVAAAAGIPVLHCGLWVLAQRPAAAAVLQAFASTAQGEGCTLHPAAQAARLAPALRTQGAQAALYSPHELRVESREALPRLAAWLAQAHGVQFFWGEAVLEVAPPRVRTSARTLQAQRVVLCPGTALTGVAAPWLQPHGLQFSRLQMLRIQPPAGFALGAAVMSDLSLVRYGGYADLPECAPLLRQLRAEAPEALAHGIHLIAVQSADGSLVVGDSHHRVDAADPFTPGGSEAVDALILRHLHEMLALGPGQGQVLERWSGVYPQHPVGAAGTDVLIAGPDPRLRVVVVTSGTGASTAFAIGEEVVADW